MGGQGAEAGVGQGQGQGRAGLDAHGVSPPRLVALDIDGTLLAPGNVLAPAAARALGRAVAAGATVVLASGRVFVSTAGWAERLGLTGPLIAYNGALVRTHPGGETWWHQPVPLPAARRVAAACRANGWYLQVYVDDRLLVPWHDARTDEYARTAGVPFVVDAAGVYDPPAEPTKLLVIEPPERMAAVRATLAAAAGDERLEMATSFPHYLEITAPGISKGVALTAVARRLGVPRAAILAVGDGRNDLSLLQAAGVGVAVANADPALRAAAQRVTAAPYGDGVAEALSAFFPD
jgi:Cof subfamily protein (haloacid dehalogenase superfamily)